MLEQDFVSPSSPRDMDFEVETEAESLSPADDLCTSREESPPLSDPGSLSDCDSINTSDGQS